ncbi:MAG TPA: hypothetical protein VH022_06720, partial [Candidatus Acidoferrum sp.]|nr:hypothetical protein [Candidatus Acidoferrum sp.]
GEREIVFLREVTVKAQRAQSKIDMVLFTLSGIEGESVKWRMRGRPPSGASRRGNNYGKTDDESVKCAGLLPSYH